MPTSDPAHPEPVVGPPTSDRGPVRLTLSRHPGRDTLDGGWWPRSRDLAVEMEDLVRHFPTELGRVTRAVVSPADWDLRARAVLVSGRYVGIDPSAPDDSHLAVLTTSQRRRLRVLVIPPDFTTDQGEEALLAAATFGNEHAPADLLDTVTEHPDIDPRDHWVIGRPGGRGQ